MTEAQRINVWRDRHGPKCKLIACVTLYPETGHLYVTHVRGYNDKSGATQADYDRWVAYYSRPSKGYTIEPEVW